MDLPTNGKGGLRLPKMAVAAVAIGFFAGALTLVAAVQHFEYLLSAILQIATGLTILRRRAWGGYGFALFETAQSLLMPALLLESANIPRAQIAASVIGGLIVALVFFLAGRALTRAGAVSRLRWPWIALTAARHRWGNAEQNREYKQRHAEKRGTTTRARALGHENATAHFPQGCHATRAQSRSAHKKVLLTPQTKSRRPPGDRHS